VSPDGDTPVRVRRAPPPFRKVEVRETERVSARMTRVVLVGPELEGFAVPEPAASVRLLLPSRAAELVLPEWNGNEFLLPGGRRPVIRTFTPQPLEAQTLRLDIVTHGSGAASDWVQSARPGAAAALSGPGRGYTVGETVRELLIGGDETAVPAIRQVLDAIPAAGKARVHIEIADPEARTDLAARAQTPVTWHLLGADAVPGDALFEAIAAEEISSESSVWIAGEAAGVQRIRKHLFGERGIPRGRTTIRGYWKQGREGGGTE
jgi:NADPH-dependent ferric siderophore reductase